MSRLRWSVRVGIVCVFAAFVIATFAPVLWSLWRVYETYHPPLPVKPISVTAEITTALEQRIDFSTSMFQAGLLLLAGLWGLVFAEQSRAYSALSEWPEAVMLLLATATLLSSAFSHFVFVWEMTSLLASAQRFKNQIPDIDSIDVAYALFSQMLTLLGGTIIGGTVFASGRWLKADEANRAGPRAAF